MTANTRSPAASRKPSDELTAKRFIAELRNLRRQDVVRSNRSLAADADDQIMGVRMGQIFALSKEFIDMPLREIEILLENPFHEVRVGAVSIMDFEARSKKTRPERRKELFDLYLRRHDRINSWDLVDRSAIYVVGGYLFDKPRRILYKLARSKFMAERRTAVVATLYFIRQGDLEDAFKLAELLLDDREDLIHKATGWALRYAGDKDRKRLLEFLDRHAARMPRAALRNAIEKFEPRLRKQYLKPQKRR